MSLARLECMTATVTATAIASFQKAPAGIRHILVVTPLAKTLAQNLPARPQLAAVLKRRELKPAELAKSPLALDLPEGGRCAYVMVDPAADRFSQLTVLRKAALLLLDETPTDIALVMVAAEEQVQQLAEEALYVLWVNGVPLPSRKKKPQQALKRIVLHAAVSIQASAFAAVAARARANLLARQLTATAPNELTPAHYRQQIGQLAKAQRWGMEEFDVRRLKRMGAGAFCAVAQGSGEPDAAIVHLSYKPRTARRRVALVGKGICFDTGGHNLKPAKYMAGMHEDMNGSAVALALLQLVQDLHLPLQLDVWLAIAQNHLSPLAYKQNDIVTALDGTHIEIVHTDAEGRLVLADTLTLATQGARAGGKRGAKEELRPDMVIDFATLTGSMITALGTRYSGVFASDDALAGLAVAAGRQAGERVCVFPMDPDYEPALDSKVADIKQCTLDGEADHILAARFLKRFTHDVPWLHVDLAAANCSGGLGAVASDVTGFGVLWGSELLAQWLAGTRA